METYICVLDIDQRDLRTKDENKLRHMKQKQFRLTGVWEYVHFLFFFILLITTYSGLIQYFLALVFIRWWLMIISTIWEMSLRGD